jgi:hypothetical protein
LIVEILQNVGMNLAMMAGGPVFDFPSGSLAARHVRLPAGPDLVNSVDSPGLYERRLR